jgi:hypothetical protein
MKTISHLSQYLAKLFLELQTFWRKVVEKIKTHISRSVSENRAVCEMSQNMAQPENHK